MQIWNMSFRLDMQSVLFLFLVISGNYNQIKYQGSYGSASKLYLLEII